MHTSSINEETADLLLAEGKAIFIQADESASATSHPPLSATNENVMHVEGISNKICFELCVVPSFILIISSCEMTS